MSDKFFNLLAELGHEPFSRSALDRVAAKAGPSRSGSAAGSGAVPAPSARPETPSETAGRFPQTAEAIFEAAGLAAAEEDPYIVEEEPAVEEWLKEERTAREQESAGDFYQLDDLEESSVEEPAGAARESEAFAFFISAGGFRRELSTGRMLDWVGESEQVRSEDAVAPEEAEMRREEDEEEDQEEEGESLADAVAERRLRDISAASEAQGNWCIRPTKRGRSSDLSAEELGALRAEEHLAHAGGVPWDERGPAVDLSPPTHWRGQALRTGVNGGKVRYANRGGRFREWYAELYANARKGKNKGKGKEKGKSKDENKGKGKEKGKEKGKGKSRAPASGDEWHQTPQPIFAAPAPRPPSPTARGRPAETTRREGSRPLGPQSSGPARAPPLPTVAHPPPRPESDAAPRRSGPIGTIGKASSSAGRWSAPAPSAPSAPPDAAAGRLSRGPIGKAPARRAEGGAARRAELPHYL